MFTIFILHKKVKCKGCYRIVTKFFAIVTVLGFVN